jgi:hypothetical protein
MSFDAELATFMAITRRHESGRYEGNYGVYGPPVGKNGNRARGAYQILTPYWRSWAAKAGIPGANWRDKKAQDRVAAHQFKRYYDAFGGNWDLVSVAWYAGGSRAKRVFQKYGANASLQQIRKELGDQIYKYAARNHKFGDELFSSGRAENMNLGPITWNQSEKMAAPEGESGDELDHPNPTYNQAGGSAAAIIRANLEQMANVQAGGRRLAIQDVETQRIQAPEEVTESGAD